MLTRSYLATLLAAPTRSSISHTSNHPDAGRLFLCVSSIILAAALTHGSDCLQTWGDDKRRPPHCVCLLLQTTLLACGFSGPASPESCAPRSYTSINAAIKLWKKPHAQPHEHDPAAS
ncbi:hypothetical protein M8818_007323 [Zalaria obscura]|uniref:Uncharacterized protein n=1 Tax=Zalaria obscura TaxID=2024903 RepID=A0ACC3S3Z8_9PEZI